jgi:uncharacterized protein YggL (DUF469 family)
MLKREEKKLNINDLQKLVHEVLLSIQDNNQNMKDCKELLLSIQNIIKPNKTRWEKFKDIFR